MHLTETPTLSKYILLVQILRYIFLFDNMFELQNVERKVGKLAIRSEALIGLTNRDYSMEQLDCLTGHLYSNVGCSEYCM